MYKRNITFTTMFLTLVAAMPVSATELSYTNITVGYQTQATDDFSFDSDSDLDFDGIKFDGSFAVTDSFFLRADYLDLGSDTVNFGPGSNNIDVSRYSIGVGFHFPVTATTDLVTTLSYTNVDKDFPGVSISEDGFIVSGGFRSKPTNKIEIGTAVNYVDVGDESDMGFGVTGRVFVLPVASVGLSYDRLDNDDRFTLDLRYDF